MIITIIIIILKSINTDNDIIRLDCNVKQRFLKEFFKTRVTVQILCH